ncbi:hypothetical protein LXL04_015760 [Taraxacum kok-saghyz]
MAPLFPTSSLLFISHIYISLIDRTITSCVYVWIFLGSNDLFFRHPPAPISPLVYHDDERIAIEILKLQSPSIPKSKRKHILGATRDRSVSKRWEKLEDIRFEKKTEVGSLSTSMKFGKDCSFLSISVYDWRRYKVIFIFILIKSNLAVFLANAAVSERTESLLSLHSDSLQPLTPVVSYTVFYSVSPFRKFPRCLYQDLRRRRLGRCGRRLGFLLEGNFETTYSSNAMPALKKTEPGDIRQLFERLMKEIGEPVEFELPDSLNKWKPNYTIIKRNIYLTKKVKKRVREEDDGIFCSCTSTPGSSAACGRDCHCGMLLSSCSSNCKCDNSCLNKPFHRRPMKKMKIVQTEKCGSGVVDEENIRHGEFIIEYVGEVIDDKTCEERLWRMKRQGETNFYLCEINRDMVIDVTFKGNQSRYINQVLFSKYRNAKMFGADQDCHCGAKGCRQKLGAKPNKSKFPSSDAALKIVACQLRSRMQDRCDKKQNKTRKCVMKSFESIGRGCEK